MKTGLPPVAGLLFLSGLCALVYQLAWLREFRLVFGASTAASAAVLAIFMGGLGLGNAWLGRQVDRHPQPLRFYARLEFCIALSAAASPLLVDVIRALYIGLGGQSALGGPGAALVRLLLSALVLGLPTVLMGGTLPAAVCAATARSDLARRAAALLYGVNTLGAVCGTALGAFWALEACGTRATLWLAAAINLGVSLTAFALTRGAAPEVSPPTASKETPRPPVDSAAPLSPASLIYATAGLVGAAFFWMELVWYRMLGPLLGGTTYTFGLILCMALAGIGLGGAAYPLGFIPRRVTLANLALSCGLEALCLALPFALGDRLALWTAHLHQANTAGFAGEVWGWTLVAGVVIFPAAFVSGLQFPLLVALLGRAEQNVGRHVGLAVAANTWGAILGSLSGGFGLLPLLTAPGLWRSVVTLLALWSAGLMAVAVWRSRRPIAALLPVAVSAAAVVLLFAPGPTAVWRHSGIGAGRARVPQADRNALRRWQNAERRKIVWEAEGVESSIAIAVRHGPAFIVNGKSDGSALGDAGTQIMLGVLGPLLHAEARSAFVVGLGTGETAGWLAQAPAMERVDVVELEPALDEMARRCAQVNHDVLQHPKVQRTYNDAREALLTSRREYDLIVSEPSNPYRSGVAGLFTREFYLAGRRRLNPGGLFLQWLQAYELDEDTFRMILATLRSVYPAVELWQTSNNDLLLLGSQLPVAYAAPQLRARIAQEPFRSALLCAWRTQSLEGVAAHYLGGAPLVDDYLQRAGIPINTDDRNRLEYACARTLGRQAGFRITDIYRQSQKLRAELPPLELGRFDRDRVLCYRRTMYALLEKRVIEEQEGLSALHTAHRQALGRYLASDWQGMGNAWPAELMPPHDPTDMALLGYALAQLGDDRATVVRESLRHVQPVEAHVIGALLLWKQKRPADAVSLLVRAFQGLRDDPWPLAELIQGALDAAAQFAAADPRVAEVFYRATCEPFALQAHEDARATIGCLIASCYNTAQAARQFAAFEPYAPWTASFLKRRARVYAEAGHPLAVQAARDLREFKESQP